MHYAYKYQCSYEAIPAVKHLNMEAGKMGVVQHVRHRRMSTISIRVVLSLFIRWSYLQNDMHGYIESHNIDKSSNVTFPLVIDEQANIHQDEYKHKHVDVLILSHIGKDTT